MKFSAKNIYNLIFKNSFQKSHSLPANVAVVDVSG